jgi:DNA-directed RNA polymerase specialized sigma24 family protein
VAQHLGVSVGTVKSTASRALARLRTHHATTTQGTAARSTGRDVS